jgi:diguanylate cyclase (GGDEF)-like protein
MKVTNKGIVFINENCIGCNTCIPGCPVPGANIAKIKNGRNYIVVDENKCIHCGHCVYLCRHFAREYIDDTEIFLEDLHNNTPISIAVDPTFYLNYPDLAPRVLVELKKRGVQKIYNVSVGNDIATWAYCKWLVAHPDQGGIAGTCNAVIEYLERQHPEFLDKMIPIKPPLMCLATYVRKYLGEKNRIAYLSPCITAKDLIDSPEFKDSVQYNVTFGHLFAKLNASELELQKNKIADVVIDLPDYGLGSIFPVPGGLRQNLTHFLGMDRPVVNVSNAVYMYPILSQNVSTMHDKDLPLIFEGLNCDHGCLYGSGVDLTRCNMQVMLEQYNKKRLAICGTKKDPSNPYCRFMQSDRRIEVLNEHFKDLNVNDFAHTYTEKYEQPFTIPKDIYEEIFHTMHKDTPESRHVDCGACGYLTCYKMAEAIANGYNQIENCVHYEKVEINKLITTNPVTGSANTLMFHKTLRKLIATNDLKGKSIIYFNIKNFMLVNKRFGFNIGSAILASYAEIIQSNLTEGEFLFHAGGDTFFIICNTERVNKIIFILNHIELPIVKEKDPEFPMLTIRAGVYSLTGNEKEIENIINPINAAYLLAKRKQNDSIVFYDKKIESNIVNSLIIGQQLPAALENGELFVVFQPKVSISQRELVGAEALIRWRHDGQIISPAKFIPECEANGFIKRIDFFVLNQVCKQINKWFDNQLEPVRVSVNFSKIHFTQPDVAERICNVIDSWKVPHNLIEIEFTETSFLEEKDNLKRTVQALNEKKIISSIDDFGTGYSSISLLHELDFSVLKFDKTFIDTVVANSRAETVVKDIVRMAKDLNMHVVAEGVETESKLCLLKELGSDMVQGFIFDKPLEEKEFEKRLANKIY